MENLHEHFGLAIKNARLDCGLTQEALAERAQLIHMLETCSDRDIHILLSAAKAMLSEQ